MKLFGIIVNCLLGIPAWYVRELYWCLLLWLHSRYGDPEFVRQLRYQLAKRKVLMARLQMKIMNEWKQAQERQQPQRSEQPKNEPPQSRSRPDYLSLEKRRRSSVCRGFVVIERRRCHWRRTYLRARWPAD